MAHIAVLLSVSKLEAFRTAECIKAKADGFILKPFEAGELVVTVDKLGERVHPMNTSISRALAVPKLGIVPHCSSGENVDHIKRVGHDGFLQQERGEVCDVCGYVNQGHAFVCQQCDVPLPGSVSQSSVSFRSR